MHKHYDLVVIGTGAANIVVDAAVRQGLHIGSGTPRRRIRSGLY